MKKVHLGKVTFLNHLRLPGQILPVAECQGAVVLVRLLTLKIRYIKEIASLEIIRSTVSYFKCSNTTGRKV